MKNEKKTVVGEEKTEDKYHHKDERLEKGFEVLGYNIIQDFSPNMRAIL